MTKYKKKPVVIEAKQLRKDNIREIYSWVFGEPTITDERRWFDYIDIVQHEGLRIKTLESDNETQIASINDYIVKGIKGEFYPVKPDIFETTYEEVED